MGDSPFQLAVAAVLRPLEFAAQDDFARLGRVRDLESSIAGAAERAGVLSIPPDAKKIFARVAKSFSSSSDADLAERVRDALERVRPLAEPSWSEAELARSPAILPGLGPKRAEILARRGLRTVGDLLFYLPTRYDDRRSLQSVDSLEVLILRRIHVTYKLRAPAEQREVIERVHGFHARKCPVFRSLEAAIDITTELELLEPELVKE